MLGSSRWVALGAALGCALIASCRGSTKHGESNEGDAGSSHGGQTSPEPPSDAGESSGDPAPGGAGEGGANSGPMPHACVRDDDCNDAQRCNGTEDCQDGRCAAGVPFECSGITVCTEGTNAPGCVVPPSEQLVAWVGKRSEESWETLFGASLNQLDAPPQLDLSAGGTDAKFSFVDEDYEWSPDGRRLLIPVEYLNLDTLDTEVKVYWSDLDQPLEGQPRRLIDVPISDGFNVSSWSASANAVLLGYEDDDVFYAVRFTAASAQTAQVEADAAPRLCDDDETVAYSANGVTHLASVWSSPVREQVLPAVLRGCSPDGKWLLLSDEQHAYLARCGADAKLEPLGGPAAHVSGWSSDSQYVVYSDGGWDSYDQDEAEEETTKTLTGFRVETKAAHSAVFEAKSLVPEVDFEPGSTRFVFLDSPEDGPSSRRLRDIGDPQQDRAIELENDDGEPIFPHLYWLGRTGRWLYTLELPRDEDGLLFTSYYTLASAPGATPTLRETIWESPYYSADASHMIWVDQLDDAPGARKQAYTLDLTSDTATRHPLFPEPLTGELSLPYDTRQSRIITRTIETPQRITELYVVPEDFEGEPVRVDGADLHGQAALRPPRR